MSKFLKISLASVISLSVLVLARTYFQEKESAVTPKNTTPEVVTNNSQNELPKSWDIPLSDLNIAPVRSIENEVYVFTAFDMIDEQTMAIIGNFEQENIVKFYDIKRQKLITEIKMDEIMLDVFVHNDHCYVLGEKSLFIIHENQVIHSFSHDIPAVFTFDRMLSLGNKLFVSMSDGSAWQMEDKKLTRQDKLHLNGNPLWIQKTSPSTFSIEIARDKTIDIESDLTLGAMTVLGAVGNDLICITERITQTRPMSVMRSVGSSKDEFSVDLYVVNMQPFAFLKNDLRLHGSTVFHLTLHSEKLSLTAESIEK